MYHEGVEADPLPPDAPMSPTNSVPLESSLAGDLDTVARSIHESVWAGRTRSYRPPTVEDADEEDTLESGGDAETPELSEEDREVWERMHTEQRQEAEYEAISVWDELAELFIREGMIKGQYGLFSVSMHSLTRAHRRQCTHGRGLKVLAAVRSEGGDAYAWRNIRDASSRLPR